MRTLPAKQWLVMKRQKPEKGPAEWEQWDHYPSERELRKALETLYCPEPGDDALFIGVVATFERIDPVPLTLKQQSKVPCTDPGDGGCIGGLCPGCAARKKLRERRKS